MLINKGFHLLLRESVNGFGKLNAVFARPILNELIGTEALLALLAVHKRVGKAAQVTGGDPCLRVHKYGGVQTDVIRVFLNKFFPPCAFDVVFQLHAQRTVVPCVGKPAVDFASGENEATVFTQGNYLVHGFFCVLHTKLLSPRLATAGINIFGSGKAAAFQNNMCRGYFLLSFRFMPSGPIT